MDFRALLQIAGDIELIDAQLRTVQPNGQDVTVQFPIPVEIAGKHLADGTVPHYRLKGVVVDRVK